MADESFSAKFYSRILLILALGYVVSSCTQDSMINDYFSVRLCFKILFRSRLKCALDNDVEDNMANESF